MKRLAGQAGRTIGYLIHHTGMIAMTVFFVLALALGGFAYRLSLGPMQIPWLASRLANIVSGEGVDIHIGRAALAWGGYKDGGGVPLYLQLGAITVTSAAGVELAEIPTARLVFLPGALVGSQAPIMVSSADALFAGSDVPVSLVAAIGLKSLGKLGRADLDVTLGAGHLGAAGMTFPIAGGHFSAAITPHDVSLSNGMLHLARSGASAPNVFFSGSAHLDQDWQARLVIGADLLHADDLAFYWPAALAKPSRSWVVYNITKGIARAARFTVTLRAPPSLASLALETASGQFAAQGLNVGWIPGAQPITAVGGVFTLTDRDTIDISADAGSLGGITLSAAHMRMSGLSANPTMAALTVPVAGTVQQALAVLKTPPLNFLKSMPPQLLALQGGLTGSVSAGFPMIDHLSIAQVTLDITAALSDVIVPLPVAGLDLTQGMLQLHATTQRLDITGGARLAGQPAQLAAAAIFGPGSPAVSFKLQTVAGNALLRKFGLNADSGGDDGVIGSVPISVGLNSPPTGPGRATLDADFSRAAISVPALGWSKQPGQPGRLALVAAIENQEIDRLLSVSADAPGLDIKAAADPAMPRRLDLTRLNIDGTSAHGFLTAPASPALPWVVAVSGPSLDVTAILNPPKHSAAGPGTAPKPVAKAAAPSGPLWTAQADFQTFRLAAHGAPVYRALFFSGNGQGGQVFAATAQATASEGQYVNLRLTPDKKPGDGGALELDSNDGGYLLRALGAFDDLDGGALMLNARIGPAGESSGVVMLQTFRLMRAPEFTKVLQGLTIYGAADAASGPGLDFERLVAPFAITGQTLRLTGARAFSSSLGFTASGRIDLASGAADLDTTIVPAYALNAALGRIPVLGKIFSAEKGGGLFAVRAKITGTLTAPRVQVNPLSALTPGVLRDVFGLSGSPGQ
jgi:hypothetical protein